MDSVPSLHSLSLAFNRSSAAPLFTGSSTNDIWGGFPGAGAVPSWAATVRARRVRFSMCLTCHQVGRLVGVVVHQPGWDGASLVFFQPCDGFEGLGGVRRGEENFLYVYLAHVVSCSG